MKVAIIGGGISGLTTAFYIKQAQPDWQLHIIEAADHLGGTMYTKDVDGYHFEVGSNGFLSSKPDTLDLVKAAGADDLLLRSSDEARIRFIYHSNGLHGLPETPPAFIKSKLLTWAGKLRVASEPFRKAKTDDSDETLQSFGYRRVGKEMTDIFLDAMSAGVFGNKPDTLSVKAAFPAVVALERDYGGLFMGMFKKRKKQAGPGGVLMSFKGGVGRFIEHLHNTLDAHFHIGEAVSSLTRTEAGYALSLGGEAQTFDKVIIATPAYAASDMLKGIDADLAAKLGNIDYTPISVVGLGWDNLPHPLHGFGLLTTAAAKQEVLGVLWDSSVFDDRAPKGKKLIRLMIGGQRQPHLAKQSDEDLIATARRGLKATMGIDTPPDATFVQRWDRGIPNYQVGHLDRVDEIFADLHKHSGLYLSSNAYYGIGINDCVKNSRECAERVVAE